MLHEPTLYLIAGSGVVNPVFLNNDTDRNVVALNDTGSPELQP